MCTKSWRTRLDRYICIGTKWVVSIAPRAIELIIHEHLSTNSSHLIFALTISRYSQWNGLYQSVSSRHLTHLTHLILFWHSMTEVHWVRSVSCIHECRAYGFLKTSSGPFKSHSDSLNKFGIDPSVDFFDLLSVRLVVLLTGCASFCPTPLPAVTWELSSMALRILLRRTC
jgi:hypothetical protein